MDAKPPSRPQSGSKQRPGSGRRPPSGAMSAAPQVPSKNPLSPKVQSPPPPHTQPPQPSPLPQVPPPPPPPSLPPQVLPQPSPSKPARIPPPLRRDLPPPESPHLTEASPQQGASASPKEASTGQQVPRLPPPVPPPVPPPAGLRDKLESGPKRYNLNVTEAPKKIFAKKKSKHGRGEPQEELSGEMQAFLADTTDKYQVGKGSTKVGPPDLSAMILPEDLLAQKRRLKATNRRAEFDPVKLGRRDLLHDFDWNMDYLPLPMMTQTICNAAVTSDLVSLDLRGIEQLTDMMFYIIKSKRSQFPSMEGLIASGCVHLTDQGLTWASEAFPNLINVDVQGCSQITEKGIHILSKNCEKLHKLMIAGTGIRRLPAKLAETHMSNLTFEGCPLISTSPQISVSSVHAVIGDVEESKEFTYLPDYKIVILRDEDIDVSISSLFTGSTNQNASPGLLFTKEWLPDPTMKLEGKFNVLEVQSNDPLADAVISPGSIIVIAFAPKESDSTALYTRLARRVAAVLTKCRDVDVSLLAIQGDTTLVSVEDILVRVMEKLGQWEDEMMSQLNFQSIHPWKYECIDFVNQISMAAGVSDLEVLQDILKNNLIKTLSMSKSKPDRQAISNFMYTCLERVKARFPWLFDKIRKEIITMMVDVRPRIYWNLYKIYHNIDEDSKKILNHLNCYQQVGSLVLLMNTMGRLLYFPSLQESPCISDLPHFETVLQSLVSDPAPDCHHIKCLGPDIPAWSQEQLLDFLQTKVNPVQATGLQKLLVKLGVIMPFTDPDSSSQLYVKTSDIPEKPAVELVHLWTDSCTDDTLQAQRFYTLLPGIPPSFFPAFVRKCMKLFVPTLVWKHGMLLQQGPVYILAELQTYKDSDLRGSTAVVLSARLPCLTPTGHPSTQVSRKCLFSALNIVTHMMDYLLRKCNIYAAITVPCSSCMEGKDRHFAMQREKVYHFTAHIVIAGQGRGILCKFEKEQKMIKSRPDKLLLLGEDIPSIVPYHNYAYLAATNHAIEIGDPGEDELEFGPALPWKKISVSPRIDRCCVCGLRKESLTDKMLCHHCGLCRSCVTYLAKVENFVKPSFVTPNLIAMRELKGVENAQNAPFILRDHITTGMSGSMLFPNKGIEYQVLQPMTPTYFNMVVIKPIQGCNMSVRIHLKGFSQQVEYNVLTGGIVDLNGSITQNDEWKCRDGYSVTVQVQDNMDPQMLDIVFSLCGEELWRTAYQQSEVLLSVRFETTGYIILHTPSIKQRQGPKFEEGMYVGVITQDKLTSATTSLRIAEVAKSDSTTIGLLTLKPVYTPMTTFIVTVITGDEKDANKTPGNVYIQLYGDRGQTDKIPLKKTSKKMFQSGCEDKFILNTKDIGIISSIRLGHSGMREEDRWYVSKVLVDTPILGCQTSFVVNTWLSAHLGDKQVEKIFYAVSSKMEDSLQEHFSPLSKDIRPVSLQQWKDITQQSSNIDEDKQPVFAPPWIFYALQMQSDYKSFIPGPLIPNVNDLIMPCTNVLTPSVVWCRMMKMRDKVERTLFQYSHLDFCGSSNILLPQTMTEKEADWPSPALLTAPKNMHGLCYIRGDMSTTVTLRATYTLADYLRPFWTAHLIASPGFPFDLQADQLTTVPVLWAWHFVLVLSKQFRLPDYKAVFNNPDTLPPPDKLTALLETYLRQMCYFLFLAADPDFSTNYFSSTNSHLAEGAVGTVRYPLLENFDKTGLMKMTTLFSEEEIYMCPSHYNSWQANNEITEVPLDKISDYSPYMLTLHLQGNTLTSIPKELFLQLPNLKDLDLSSNQISELPEEIGLCVKMLNFSVQRNQLRILPESIANMKVLNRIDISNNQLTEIPPCITKLEKLVCLHAKTMQLTSLPEDIGNLKMLEMLYLNENAIHALPESFKTLVNLKELALNGLSWVKIKANTILSKRNFENTLNAANLMHWLDANEQNKTAIFQYFDENTNGTLEPKEIGKLNATIFYSFPRFGYMGTEPPDEDTESGFPEEILHLERLEYLSLQYHGIVSIPDDIDRLKNLKVLNLSHNPYLLSIPAQTGNLPLTRLELDECPLLKTPPKEIRAKGFATTFSYLKRLLSGSVDCQRTKLMMVGLGGAGKTSLVKALLSGNYQTKLSVGEDITDGIDICPWTVTTDEGQVTFSVWDFAGQTVYYNTHQFFLSDRAVYILLWNIRLGHEHAGLDFWLSSISVHAPNAPIFVVGTHVDQVSKVELPVKQMQQRYPQITAFHFVSSHTGQGVQQLQENLIDVTLQQSYMGEKIPGVWLSFEKQIVSLRSRSVIEYKELEKTANACGIFSQSEVYQAVQFLHELGSLQYFTNEYLKAYVVVNPQWIVDVMACVVSVKDSHIKDGRLRHEDIAKIWKDYPESLHSWMLRLTEEYDLTFPLATEAVNLVPCLLPEREPEYTWPELDRNGAMRETKMVYKFDYLPAGLFNRGQVRLHQFSDSALIWKRGSFLMKNKHVCLIQQTRQSELVVRAHGPRPENIVFLVHEVFETLISESFQGVTYDFLLPCPDCMKLMLKDPHMFSASTIRRASELRAPFLQCLKYFHTISIVELQGMMPPDSNVSYDIHLVQAVQGLKELSKVLMADIFVSYCYKNAPADWSGKAIVHPATVCTDLDIAGYKCWYREDTNRYSTDEMAKALMDSGIILVFISNDYVQDESCCNMFKYARLTLRKPMILVVVGTNMEWKASKLGILMADEVFISMLHPDRYRNKFEELLKVLKVRVHKEIDDPDFPPCFISYCWKNSAQAVAKGTKTTEGGVGFGDPREIKKFLDDNELPCWLDVERVGLHGLFEDIAEGLIYAKVVIVCISDEYAASPNCTMEFRYAANTLKLPMILAVVGTGNNWRASEIGVMTLNYPIVSFQENNKTSFQKLLTLVKSCLPEDHVDNVLSLKQQKDRANEDQKSMSYQELCELAQRKFLRQVVQYADDQDTAAPYPRLFLIDFVQEDADGASDNTDSQSTGHKDFLKHPLCVQILCEHDEGWHSCSEPLSLVFNITTLEKCAPYIARIGAIAKYSKKLILSCLSTDTGREFMKWVEESPQVVDCSDFHQIYHDVRQEVIEADPKRIMGNLARCHLPNGKIAWLCEEHRKMLRVTVLSDEVAVTSHSTGDLGGVDFMLQAMKELDYDQVPSAIRNLARGSKRKGSKSSKTPDLVDGLNDKKDDDVGKSKMESDRLTKDRPLSASSVKSQDSQKSKSSTREGASARSPQKEMLPAQRSLKKRGSVGPPRIGNKTTSRACSVM